jgi:hypothetical protein
MTPLSENLKREVAGILTGRDRTKKGILTLLGQGLGSDRVIQGSAKDLRLTGGAAGALAPEEREAESLGRIEELASSDIATACENETRAVLNAVGGKVDPTMGLLPTQPIRPSERSLREEGDRQ